MSPSVPSQSCGTGAVLGSRVERSCGAASLGRCLCSSLQLPPPLFPRFKHRLCQLQKGTSVPQAGSRSRYLPGGAWQPWRRLKGRRTQVFCLCLTVHGDADPLPLLPPFPELIHGCYSQEETEQLWPAARFFSSAPTIVWPLVLKSASLASELETKRNRICLSPAQQMVVVIAKALINPSGLRRVQSGSAACTR